MSKFWHLAVKLQQRYSIILAAVPGIFPATAKHNKKGK